MDGNSPVARIRILVVDDHLTFAELLAGALDQEPDLVCVGHATSAADAVRMCDELRPDLVIMDVQLSDGDGLTASSTILQKYPRTRVIVLTAHATTEIFEQAAKTGACAFLTKDGSLSTMLQTIRHAQPGSMVVTPGLVAAQATFRYGIQEQHTRIPSLTPREAAVLELMGEGKDVRIIAKDLGVSPHTCRGYVKSILSKLGAHSQLEAVVIASRLNLIRQPQQRFPVADH
ncbi:response regulator transcription factor [Arthrobacter sp. H14]|uniref:response regulator transcription factor n=1 Tax=Arthrobacter sp. H14 TaxID=1312959 RepID=UPI00047876AA|nr:response regulator transcription factor [Arthrobacter sp. H14]